MSKVHMVECAAHAYVVVLEQIRFVFLVFIVCIHEEWWSSFDTLCCLARLLRHNLFYRENHGSVFDLTDWNDFFQRRLGLISIPLFNQSFDLIRVCFLIVVDMCDLFIYQQRAPRGEDLR